SNLSQGRRICCRPNAVPLATIPQWRYLSKTTTQHYLDFCKSHKIPPHTVPINYGTAGRTPRVRYVGHPVLGHWIGDENADIVVLHFHGRAFALKAGNKHFEFWHRCMSEDNAGGKRKSVAALMLAYTTIPEKRYPAQICEAAAALTHPDKSTSKSLSKIMLSGDSAGAGLAMSVLSHLLHLHSDIPPVELTTPLFGALLMSPWNSIARYAKSDVVPASVLRRWAAVYMGESNDPQSDSGLVVGDAYTEPFRNESSWWHGMHRVVDDVLFWYGGEEILLDSIHDLVPLIKQGWAEGGGEVARITVKESP
ncbi:hypothetical protein BU23DRAFT_653335, partial [Bimuria novae-zelandiae CBS 107.79]